MKNYAKAVLTFGALITATGLIAIAPQAKASTEQTVNVYRLYNPNTGEHFYTTSAAEKDVDVVSGWIYEGTGWVAPTTGVPVYRVYNPNAKGGDHYYTKSMGEATTLVQLGWKWDNDGKPVFYSGGDVNVSVAYNPYAQSGAHNYTTSSYEQNSLLGSGWKYGAVAFNAVESGKTITTKMNLPEIAKGDYSSIKGTWKNANGLTLTVTDTRITAIDGWIEGDKTSIKGVQSIRPEMNGQTLDLTLEFPVFDAWYSFVPKGAETMLLTDDTSKVKSPYDLIISHGDWGNTSSGAYRRVSD